MDLEFSIATLLGTYLLILCHNVEESVKSLTFPNRPALVFDITILTEAKTTLNKTHLFSKNLIYYNHLLYIDIKFYFVLSDIK